MRKYPIKELKLLGAALYLSEGTKLRVDNRGWKYYDVEFTNTDPRMMRVYSDFARRVLKLSEEKLRVQVFVYPDHDERESISFWSKTLNIPVKQFTK